MRTVWSTTIQFSNFGNLFDEIHKEGRLRRPKRWRLQLRSTRETIYFDGMLSSLLRWARGEGLLRGQHNRLQEPLLVRIRNYVAHQSGLSPAASRRRSSGDQ
jgi:hypothetical protein